MTVTVVTGKMGAGKNLYAVARLEEYARQGRRCAANFRVNLGGLLSWWERLLGRRIGRVETLSAQPTYDELRELGRGGKREDIAGLLVLDECAALFNARAWQDRDRGNVIKWLLHTRKLGWDVLLIVQNAALIDKQIRIAVVEMAVNVRRLDKLKVLGILKLPRIHVATERYGTEANAVRASVRAFRGNRYFSVYDTQELIIESHAADGDSAEADCARHERGRPPVVPVPQGVRSPRCPVPADALGAAFLDIAVRLGVLRSVLPPDYFTRSDVDRAVTT